MHVSALQRFTSYTYLSYHVTVSAVNCDNNSFLVHFTLVSVLGQLLFNYHMRVDRIQDLPKGLGYMASMTF